MGPKVITDHDVYKYLESWTSLNMNPAVKEACDATGTSPFSHEMHGATISTGEVVSHPHEQEFHWGDKGTETYMPGFSGDGKVVNITVAQGGLLVSQCASDATIARKIYNKFGLVTLLEPIVTGIFKASIRDDSNKKSPFIAFDKNWSLRFNIRSDLLKSLFQIHHSRSEEVDLAIFQSFVKIEIKEAYLHVQYAKPNIRVPRHIRYSWPRFKVYSKSWQYVPDEPQTLEWSDLRQGSIPDAVFITHRLKTEDGWFDPKHINATLQRSAFVREL
jgi:hypothetical protein